MTHHRGLVIALVVAVVVAVVGIGVMELTTNDTDEPASQSPGDSFAVDGHQLRLSLTDATPSLGDYQVSMQLIVTGLKPDDNGHLKVVPNPPANHCSSNHRTIDKDLDPGGDVHDLGYTATTSGSCAIQDSKGHWFVDVIAKNGKVIGHFEASLDEGYMGLYRARCVTLESATLVCIPKADPVTG